MNYRPIHQIQVSLVFHDDPLPVGRLALRGDQIYFEYDRLFFNKGLEISPLKCPLRPGVQTFDPFLFEGLPGVFNDSLPDGWGRLLLDRKVRSQGMLPEQFSPLDRLAHVGHTGIGALMYEPDYGQESAQASLDLHQLAMHVQQVLNGKAEDVLQELLALNGSSAGARPKVMVGVDDKKCNIIYSTQHLPNGFESWLVKFPNAHDGLDAGAIEYVYALMAMDAGIDMTAVHLFSAQKGPGYFATKRFDRDNNNRLHTHSACGLLHSDFRTPSLDYEDLMALTMLLTRDVREAQKMFRLAVFNVLAHNRDDHAKNFSFLMDANGQWRLSPAYDLTFSSGPRSEQSTMVMGEGKNPFITHLTQLGLEAKLPRASINTVIEQTRNALSRWRKLATTHGVSKVNIDLIAEKIESSNR